MKSKKTNADEGKKSELHSMDSIADYIKKVSEEMQKYDGKIIVFRGEDIVFDKPCRPNIFRRESLILDNSFEKKLFDSMRQNGLSDDKSYLNNAIDAQHGTFPSRMLDVTYNSLVALYFAVTPFYRYAEDKDDNEDGAVYVFSFDRSYSPNSENIQEFYENMIKRKNSWLCNNIVFSKNHKFIDHCKINKRIIAQQGAFILFQGDDSEGLPEYTYSKITIPAKSKKRFRKELNELFGIHTGYIYPEIDNLTNEISTKCKAIETQDITFKSELDDIGKQLESEIEYYYDKMLFIENGTSHESTSLLRITEKVIYSYYIGILQLLNSCEKTDKKKIDCINTTIRRFNDLMDDLDNKTKTIPEIENKVNFFSLKFTSEEDKEDEKDEY